MADMGLGGYFTLSELAALLGVKRDLLRRYVKEGKLRGGVLRGQTRFYRLIDIERAGVRVRYKAPLGS
jgi:excisionase family DNA binding protein